MSWTLSQRAQKLTSSAIREILKVTERPEVISFAGGLPSPDTFPVERLRAKAAEVLTNDASPALQYGPTEGYLKLREWIAERYSTPGVRIDPQNVLVTTGSQQGLDLLGKTLIDSGSKVLVETPTYLGALQAFSLFEPNFVSVTSDEDGLVPSALTPKILEGARFLYVLPNFQNPSGRSIGAARRVAIAASAREAGVPIVEDNPYGDLWYDAEPAAPIASLWREGTIYLGSFSKVLAPGLRLGYAIAPAEVMPKLLQAKQAADLHTPSFNQRLVHEVIKDGFLREHVPTIRRRYKAQRDAMQAALVANLPQSGPRACRWQVPGGGMFFWLELPEGVDAEALLPRAVERGVAFVPGAPFYAGEAMKNTLRLSFVTVAPEAIARGVRALAAALESMP